MGIAKRTSWRKPVIITTVVMVSMALVAVSKQYQLNKTCKHVQIHIDAPTEGQFFLDIRGVRRMLGVENRLVGQKMSDIQLNDLEDSLRATRYIDSAEAFIVSSGELQINIRLRKPIARVINNSDMRSFYIDDKLRRMPVSDNYTARTILIRGQFSHRHFDSYSTLTETTADSNTALAATQNDSITNRFEAADFSAADELLYRHPTIQKMLPMLQFIHQDTFWSSMISEIVVNRYQDLVLFPTIGKLKIEFGSPENYQVKFRRLAQFYKEVLSRCGWDYYQSLSLRFNNQLVAVKAETNSEKKDNPTHKKATKSSKLTNN